MKDIFSDLFNKVFGFFRQSEQKEENAKDTAVNRLRVVLMQDRTNLTPELLEKMRGELIELLSKYVEMDKDALELNFEQEGNQMALMLSIPVLRAKDEEEIEAAEEAAEAETSEKMKMKTKLRMIQKKNVLKLQKMKPLQRKKFPKKLKQKNLIPTQNTVNQNNPLN